MNLVDIRQSIDNFDDGNIRNLDDEEVESMVSTFGNGTVVTLRALTIEFEVAYFEVASIGRLSPV